MDNDEKEMIKTDEPVLESSIEDKSKIDAIDALEEDIIRNDTIPETKDAPGSIGAYPVGAFDTSKD